MVFFHSYVKVYQRVESMAMQQDPIEDGGTDSIYGGPIFQA